LKITTYILTYFGLLNKTFGQIIDKASKGQKEAKFFHGDSWVGLLIPGTHFKFSILKF
jgi:hypothetical protein